MEERNYSTVLLYSHWPKFSQNRHKHTQKKMIVYCSLASFFIVIIIKIYKHTQKQRFVDSNTSMGKKTYFEFLEEEYQALSSELQTSLAVAHAEEQGSISNNSVAVLEQQLSRCQAVYQQLRAESRGDREFKERVQLYKIQLEALQGHLQQEQRSS